MGHIHRLAQNATNLTKLKKLCPKPKLKKKTANKAYSKSFNKAYNGLQIGRKATERWDQVRDDAINLNNKTQAYKDAKKQYKTASKQAKTYDRNSAVSKYRKAYDKNNAAQEKNDEYKREVKSLYESCGKNRIERVVNVAKGKSPEAKKYLAAAEKWTNKQDILDEDWNSNVTSLYKETGSNAVSRVINNARYDIERSKK